MALDLNETIEFVKEPRLIAREKGYSLYISIDSYTIERNVYNIKETYTEEIYRTRDIELAVKKFNSLTKRMRS